MNTPSERLRFSRLRRYYVIALVLAGILSTFFLFRNLRQRQEERDRHYFERIAAHHHAEIQSRIDSLLEVVYSVRAFYESSEAVLRPEFRRFVKDFLERYPDLESIQFLTRVAKEERDDFAAQARAEGIASDAVVDQLMADSSPTARARDEYFPIWHIEPLKHRRHLLGRDEAATPVMRTVMEKARNGAVPAATTWQILDRLDGTAEQRLAIEILLAVNSSVHENTTLQGFAACVLRVGAIIPLSLNNRALETLNLYLTESGRTSNEQRLLRASLNPKTGIVRTELLDSMPAVPPEEIWQGKLTVADRQWILTCQRTSSSAGWTSAPYLTLLLGGLVTGAFVLHQLRLSRHEKRIEKIVEERTRELVATKNFLESILENMPDVVFVKDADTFKYLRFNKAGEKIMGLSREELIGKTDVDLFSIEEAGLFSADDNQVIERRESLDIEESVRTARGKRIFQTKKIPILDEKGRPRYVLGISEDVTEEEAARQALANKAAELARSNGELEQLAHVASHDLQEPLRMIASYTSLLEKRYDQLLDEKGRQYIRFASDGARRLQRLIADLLTFSQIGTLGRDLVPVDLNHVMSIVLMNLQVSIEETGVTVRNARLPVVLGDEMELVQLFQNLLSNAIKFRGTAPPEVRITSRRTGKLHDISVQDNGIGIKPEFHDRIFTIFQRLHTRDQYSGTGIGLALCKKIVERHGGSIAVESTPGTGTLFRFTLRATDSSEHDFR